MKDEVSIAYKKQAESLVLTIQERKGRINVLEEKNEEKRKCINDAKDCIRSKDSQINYLKQQIDLIKENQQEIGRNKTDIENNEIAKLQLLLKTKEQNLDQLKGKNKIVTEKIIEENRSLRMERARLEQLVKEAKQSLQRNQEGIIVNKENQWYMQAAKLKAEVDKMRKEMTRI